MAWAEQHLNVDLEPLRLRIRGAYEGRREEGRERRVKKGGRGGRKGR